MIIIGDVAGQYDALMRLVDKMPKEPLVFVGDLVDRGPKSKEVVEWVMKNADCVMGNHEDMMIDFYRNHRSYEKDIWFWNGGDKTVESYGCKLYGPKWNDRVRLALPEEHIIWMENLPTEIRFEKEGLIVTHAPYLNTDLEFDRIWNRDVPEPVKGFFNIFGHNSHWGLRPFETVEVIAENEAGIPTETNVRKYAMCIDASSSKVVTGVQWPSLTIYQEPY